MGWQLVAMGMRMGCMLWRERGFRGRFMFRMGEGMYSRMMLCVFQMAFPVHAWPGFYRFFCLTRSSWRAVPG
jgi:hypothetical protein